MRNAHLLPTLRFPQLAFLVLLFGALFAASVPLHRAAQDLFVTLREETVSHLEARLDRRVSYTRISPAVFRALDVHDLVIHGVGGEPPVLLEIGRVRVTYGLWSLLRGRFQEAVNEIDVNGVAVNIRSDRDSDVVRFVSELFRPGEGSELPSVVLSGSDVSLSYQSGDDRYLLEDTSFSLSVGESQIDVVGEGTALAESALVPGGLGMVQTRVSLDGTVSPGFREGTATVTLTGSQSRLFQASAQAFRLDLSPSVVEVRKVRDRAPLDVAAEYDRRSGRLTARFEAAGFVPAGAVTPAGAAESIKPWLDSPVSGSGRLTFDTGSGAIAYEASVSAEPRHPDAPGGSVVSVRFSGTEAAADIHNARIRGDGAGAATFAGRVAFAPLGVEGTLSLEGARYAGYGPVHGDLTIGSTPEGAITARSDAVMYRRAVVYDAVVRAVPGDERITGSVEAALSSRGTSRIRAEATVPVEGEEAVVANLRFIDLSMERAYRTLQGAELVDDLPDRIGALEGLRANARATVSLAGGDYDVAVPFVSVYDPDDAGRGLDAAVSATPEGIAVDEMTLTWSGVTVRGSLAADALTAGVYRVASSLRTEDRDFDVRGVYRSGRSGVVTINDDVVLRGYALRAGGALFRAEADEFNVADAETPLRVSLDATGVVRSVADWSATLRGVRVEGESDPTGPFVATTNARLRPDGGNLDGLAYRDAYSDVAGRGTLDSLEEGYRLNLALSSRGGGEQYEFVGRYVNGTANGQVSFSGTSLRRLKLDPVRGSISGEFSVREVPEDPHISVRLNTSEASFNADPFSASGVVVANPRTLEMNSLQVTYSTTRLRNGSGTLDLEQGQARFDVLYEDQALLEPRRIQVSATGKFADKALPLTLSDLAVAPFDGEVVLDGIEVGGIDATRWRLGVNRTDRDVQLHGGPGGSIRGRFMNTGDFMLSLSEPLPLQFNGEGRLKSGNLEATLTGAYLDAAELTRLFDFGDVRLTDGQATGSLRIVGPVNDPDFYGTFQATGIMGEMDYLPGDLGPAEGFLIFDEKVLTINPLQVPTVDEGGAEFGGSATLQRWGVDEYRFQVATEGGQSIPMDYRSADLIAEGRAMGRLKIQGTPGVTNVTGDLVVFATSVTLGDPELATEVPEDTVTNVDVSVTTQGRAEFLWPSRDLPVLRAFAERGQTVNITSRSAPEQYSVKGTVNVQGGEIYYFDRSFFIREGRIIFDESEEGFDPRLQARAEVREVSAEGPVRIFLIVEEERLGDFTPRLESSPPLPTEEIVGILGQEFLSTGEDGGINVSSALLLPADVLQMAVLSRVENTVRDTLGLDLLSLRTQVLGNVVAGAGRAGEPLDSPQPSFGEYLNNTTLFLGKYVGTDLFLEMLLELGQTAPNEEALVNVGDVGFGAEVGMEWQTPFFLLNWSFAPQSPETLFVTDTRFEFSWEFSY